ncbi:MAG: C10 family peptidase [Bacteroidia bacterium]|nr:C10 family peptidase [Bacteroidia bacterium]
MKRFLLSALSLTLLFSAALGQSVSLETAKTVATNFYFSKDFTKNARKDIKITDTRVEKTQDETLLYIFTMNEEGFVIVANEQKVKPVLAYGIQEGGSPDSDNPAFNYWLKNYKDQIADLRKNHPQYRVPQEVTAQWSALQSDNFDREAANQLQKQMNPNGNMNTMTVSPLLTTNWGQGSSASPSYNYYCPSSGGVTAITGCVATAMAQVMRYYQHPAYGNGSQSYTEPANYNNMGVMTTASYGVLSATFGTTTYGWANMPATINSASPLAQRQAVGRLMSHCGISVEMDYSPSSSGANTPDAAAAFEDHFYYSNSGFLSRSAYTLLLWKTLLKSALDGSKPVLYRGRDNVENTGHAWVCDGYDANEYFHMNWGWNGSSNGYFSVDDLTPGSGYYNDSQGVIINSPKSMTLSSTSKSFCYAAASSSVSVTCSSVWTVTDNASWITTSAISGFGNGSFNINVTQNTTGAQRTGTVTVKGNGVVRTITVTQKGQVAFTSVSTFYPGTYGAKYSFSITSTGTFTVSDNASWITLNTLSGSSASTSVTFTTTSNTTGAVRNGTITLTGPCGETRNITISQSYLTNSCPTVSGVTLTNATQTSLTVNYPVASGATFYRIYAKKSTESVWTWRGSWAGTSVSLTGLSANTTYNVRVEAACSSTTTGNVSVIVSTTTPSSPNVRTMEEDELYVANGEGLADDNQVDVWVNAVDFKAYPNPARDNVTLSLNIAESRNVTWTMLNLNGQIIAQQAENAEAGEFSRTISLENYPAGLYILTVKSGDELYSEKIQVVK